MTLITKKPILLRTLLFPALGLLTIQSFVASAGDIVRNPAVKGLKFQPNGVLRESFSADEFRQWIAPVLKREGAESTESPFSQSIFAWFDKESRIGLPSEVGQAADKMHVNVATPRAEVEKLEAEKKIKKDTVIGAEVYAEMEGTVEQVYQALAFRWGKPVNGLSGKTRPPADPHGKRVEYFAPISAKHAGAYANLSLRRNGGFVKDLSDRYLFLIRGDQRKGYDIFMHFIQRAGDSATENCFAIATIRPLDGGKRSAFKINTRYSGQSYSFLGKDRIGFSIKKVKESQEAFRKDLKELVTTGKISETKDDLEF